jgi:hypothetical protein
VARPVRERGAIDGIAQARFAVTVRPFAHGIPANTFSPESWFAVESSQSASTLKNNNDDNGNEGWRPTDRDPNN